MFFKFFAKEYSLGRLQAATAATCLLILSVNFLAIEAKSETADGKNAAGSQVRASKTADDVDSKAKKQRKSEKKQKTGSSGDENSQDKESNRKFDSEKSNKSERERDRDKENSEDKNSDKDKDGKGNKGKSKDKDPKSAKESDSNQPMAQRVYHQVWDLIKKNFYLPEYNNQNWDRWEHKYDNMLKTDDDEQKAIDTMLASLGDKYTRYLNKAAFEDETTNIRGAIGGIGVQIAYDQNGELVALAVLEGTPAGKAGVQANDRIELINGEPTKGLTVQQASSKLRGEIGTEVLIKVLRNKAPMEFKLTRDEIVLRSVQNVEMLNSDIGYIRLSTFLSSRAGREVQEALVQLTPARGIILDLRENPGGLVSNAIDICSSFIRAGVVVSTVDRNGHSGDARVNGRFISNQPLVVLLDQNTASAAEITSGALKDTGRAALVGAKRSFGKGLVQSVTRLEDGSGVNCTIAKYVTPNGVDINKKGIEPDYIVELDNNDYKDGRGPWWRYPGKDNAKPNPRDAKDIQLKKALEVIEQKLKSESSQYELKLQPDDLKLPPQEKKYEIKLETPLGGY